MEIIVHSILVSVLVFSRIAKLINFFHVEDLKPEMRVEAERLKRSLASRLNSHVKQSIEMHELRKRKNKVKVEITCPVLEVPFSNNPQWIYEQMDGGGSSLAAHDGEA